MPLPHNWLMQQLLGPVLRPATRFLIGMIAIPVLRMVRQKVARTKEWDAEFEKDIEQWFRGSLLLFFATKNVEAIIGAWLDLKFDFTLDEKWWIAAGRLLLAIGVIESMPDQELFSIVHPGPQRLRLIPGRGFWGSVRDQAGPFVKGLVSHFLNRFSPVFVILSVIYDGPAGWACYWIAIVQYLIIGLVTSRDKALNVLSEFDKQVAKRRQELIDEFQIDEDDVPDPLGLHDKD